MNQKSKFLSFDCEECGRLQNQQIVPLFMFSASVRLRHDVCRSLPVCAEVQLQLCQRHCSVSEARLLDALQLGDHGLACPLSSSFVGRASKDVRLNVSSCFNLGHQGEHKMQRDLFCASRYKERARIFPKAFSRSRFLLSPLSLL